ncbi:unnamed protein product [Heterobilharzia americana]|nr:unnamed protein product [Heterobilharzia americana]
MLSMLSELEKIGEEIVSIEEELEAIDREFSSKESNPSQLDELEAYMNALKTSSSDRVKRSKLKARLISLRQTELQLMHRAGLTQFRRNLKKNNGQANTSEYISSSEAAAAVRAAKNKLNNNNLNSEDDQNTATSEQKIKNIRADRNALKRSLQSHARSLYVSQKKIEVDKPFEVENDDEMIMKKGGCEKEEKQIDTGPKSQPESYDLLLTKINRQSSRFSKNENMTVNNDEAVVKPSKVIRENKLSGTGKHHIRIMGPTLPHPQSQKPINPDVSRKTKLLMEADPDYVEWVPPPDQHGDGVTPLNAKYGY